MSLLGLIFLLVYGVGVLIAWVPLMRWNDGRLGNRASNTDIEVATGGLLLAFIWPLIVVGGLLIESLHYIGKRFRRT